MNTYVLIATNKQGARVYKSGKSFTDCLKKFDSEYTRSGFVICIEGNDGSFKEIKKTFK